MMLTVFTPTYNRGALLRRVYRSIVCQDTSELEWVIVDDGSTDDTVQIVEEMQRENKIDIVLIKKDNGGKHTAFNAALKCARGVYFLCVDSDDFLSDDVIQKILGHEDNLQSSDCGFIAYKSDNSGRLLSKKFDSALAKHCGMVALQRDVCITGEFALVFRTEILRRYPYPIIKGEKFIGECVVYDKMELDGFTFCPIDEIIQVCEYQPDGLTSTFSSVMRQNPTGYALYFMQRIDMYTNIKERIITAGKYNCFCALSKATINYEGKYKKMVCLTKPLGGLFWIYYKVVRKF